MTGIDNVLSKLKQVRPQGERSWMACCPAHADKNPSLSVSEGDGGRVLLKCFAGCPADKVAAALGLRLADLMGSDGKPAGDRPRDARRKGKDEPFSLRSLKPGDVWNLRKKAWAFVRWYDYEDETGAVIFRKLRFREAEGPGKTFILCVPTEDGRWLFGRSSRGVREVLYRMPRVTGAAKDGETVYVVEGEKDVESAERLGLIATCNADGAGKWKPEFADAMKGCAEVVVIADADPDEAEAKRTNPAAQEWWQGQRHATDIADSLAARGIPHRVITLPPAEGWHVKDLSDWVEAEGGCADDAAAQILRGRLEAIVRDAPPWTSDLYRRPSREEPSASGSETTGSSDAAERRRMRKTRDAQKENAAGGMPHSNGGANPSPSPNPEVAKRVGGAGALAETDPRSAAKLRYDLIGILSDRELTQDQRNKATEEAVLDWLNGRGQLYYHLEILVHSASLYFDAASKTLSFLSGDYFRSWLSLSAGLSTESRLFRYVHARVCAEAMSGEGRRGVLPEKYWARRGKTVYLSCGNGRMIRITAAAVEEVDCGTDGVLFEAGKECAPWKLTDGAGADPIDACMGFATAKWKSPRSRALFRLWLMSLPGHGDRTKPVLLVTGVPGSGKTMMARLVQRLYGLPDRAQMLCKDYKIDSFWAQADAGGMFCLDNADYYVDWMVGCLTTVSTGGTFTKRMNYKDNDLVTQRARCWCAVTGTRPHFASEPSVSDRLLTVELSRRVGGETKGDVLFDDIDEHRDACLTWICRCWQRALGDAADPPVAVNTRHPDWGLTAYRLSRAAGFEEDAVVSMTESEAAKAVFAARNDTLGEFLIEAFGVTGFSGTVTQMHEALKARCEGFAEKDWTREKIGKLINDRLKWIMEGAFGMFRKNHSNTWNYTLKPIPEQDQTPTMWGFNPPPAQAHTTSADARARTLSPPTSPTSQDFSVGERTGLFEVEEAETDGPHGPGEEAGWDAL